MYHAIACREFIKAAKLSELTVTRLGEGGSRALPDLVGADRLQHLGAQGVGGLVSALEHHERRDYLAAQFVRPPGDPGLGDRGVAQDRTLDLDGAETVGGDGDGFDRLLKLRIEGAQGVRELEATLHRGPRVVRLDGVELDFDPSAHFLIMRNEDQPGVVGKLGTGLGEAGVNIINFSLGATGGGQAVAAITVDREVPEATLARLRAIPGILSLEMV